MMYAVRNRDTHEVYLECESLAMAEAWAEDLDGEVVVVEDE